MLNFNANDWHLKTKKFCEFECFNFLFNSLKHSISKIVMLDSSLKKWKKNYWNILLYAFLVDNFDLNTFLDCIVVYKLKITETGMGILILLHVLASCVDIFQTTYGQKEPINIDGNRICERPAYQVDTFDHSMIFSSIKFSLNLIFYYINIEFSHDCWYM